MASSNSCIAATVSIQLNSNFRKSRISVCSCMLYVCVCVCVSATSLSPSIQMHANAYILLFLLLTVSYKFQLLLSRTHTNHCCCSCFYCCNFGIVVMMICVLLNATSCHISFDNALSSVLLSCLLHGLSLISAHMGASFCFALLGD